MALSHNFLWEVHGMGFKLSNGIILISMQVFKYRNVSQSVPSRFSPAVTDGWACWQTGMETEAIGRLDWLVGGRAGRTSVLSERAVG